MSSILSHPVLQSDSHNQNLHFKFPGFFLSIQIYVTSQYATDDSVSDGLSWTQTAPPTVPVSINFGKPPFERIMDSEEAEQVGAMAVTVCGPGSLSDQVRRVVRYRQKETTVDFYEESFSW